ncbi:2-phosphosulfolactate phosphatase [Jeotgalibacillus sp. S-D1]|uniref:2-phosphosulfolactate phosphatase n=1 Tax=Jeotgalibacillus sp. S-D1 TaxID=2552189 RepID=UPI00105A14DF|nr:2-phosphosulfolactate phosphatase [Jeotgalibacillus sp. S-D1]TDL31883.1 2-phosphosulfolactate phosphatase [Jeotgalibacillus sp. S-D1]
MTKIHVLFKKEEISEWKIKEGNKTAVVLDVLLATTTITSALMDGAKEVIPVKDIEEGLQTAAKFQQGSCILAGEIHAKPVKGFLYPSPGHLASTVPHKTLILSTTNGTVALRNASGAKNVYIACLLNNAAVARVVKDGPPDQTIIVICSGNSGEFSLEDFYGAGHFIDCLLKLEEGEVMLSDAALAARRFFLSAEEDALRVLSSSKVGELFCRYDFLDELAFASQFNITSIVPVLKDGRIVLNNPNKDNREEWFDGTSKSHQ